MATQGLKLPGTSGNYASTPDAAALDITGDIDIRVWAVPDDYTPAATDTLASKWTATGNQRSWTLDILASGALKLNWSADGTAVLNETSSASDGGAALAAPGDAIAFRATLDVSTGDVNFYTSADGSTWDALGVTQTGVATAVFDSTAVCEIGTLNAGTAQPFAGTIQKVEVYDGIDGTLAASPDFEAQAAGTTEFDDSTGKTWTVNYTTDANDPTLLPHDGTNHYVYLPGSTTNYLTGPNVDLSGDIELVAHLKFDALTINMDIISDRLGSTGEAMLRFDNAGNGFQFWWYESAVAKQQDSDNHNLSIGDTIWVKATRENDIGGTARIVFYTSDDGVDWTELSSHTPAVAAPTANSQAHRIGGNVVGFSGNVYYAHAKSFDGGTSYFTFDPANDITDAALEADPDAGQSTITSSATGEVWTVNRSTGDTAKTVVVTRPVIMSDGLNDYIDLTVTPSYTHTAGKLSVAWCGRIWDSALNGRILDAFSDATNGFHITYATGDLFQVNNKATGNGWGDDRLAGQAGVSDGTLRAVVVVVDDGTMTMWESDEGTYGTQTDTLTATPDAFDNFRLNSISYAVSTETAIETMAVIVDDGTAWTAAQANSIITRLLAGGLP